MQNRLGQQLEKAQALCSQGEFYKAYGIFKRYFDRIPFELDDAHVHYVNQFGRCLGDLSRLSEIRFYVAELERSAHRYKPESVNYLLGVFHCIMTPPDLKKGRLFLENVLRGTPSIDVKLRCKIWLAYTYENLEKDYRTCRKIINSIEPVEHSYLMTAVSIWKGLLLREEGDAKGAEKILKDLKSKMESGDCYDWYMLYSTKVILASLYLRTNRRPKALELYKDLEAQLGDKPYAFSRRQLEWLSNKLRPSSGDDTVSIAINDKDAKFTFQDLHRTVSLCSSSNIHRMLKLFSEQTFLSKETIVNQLYGREYSEKKDDKLVYYHIHALRKFLVENGLSDKAIMKHRDGYAIAPKVLNGATV